MGLQQAPRVGRSARYRPGRIRLGPTFHTGRLSQLVDECVEPCLDGSYLSLRFFGIPHSAVRIDREPVEAPNLVEHDVRDRT